MGKFTLAHSRHFRSVGTPYDSLINMKCIIRLAGSVLNSFIVGLSVRAALLIVRREELAIKILNEAQVTS